MVMFGLPVALVVMTLAAAQRAPSPDEQKAFAEGLRLYEAGDARGAERAWKQGYAAGHDPAFLVRIGEAEEKAGAPKEAAQSYEQYLRESPDAVDRPEIEARLRRLGPPSPPKPPLEIETPGEMRSPPGTSAGTSPGTAPAPASSATPAPTTPAAQPSAHPASSAAGAEREGARAKAPQARDDAEEDLSLVENDAARSTLGTVAWVATGVTVLLLGVAAFYGASAADKSGDANRLLTYADEQTFVPQEYALHAAQYEEDVRVGQRDDRIAKGLALAAGVTAVTAVVLFVADARSERRATGLQARATPPVPRPGIAPAGLGARMRTGADPGLDLSFSWHF